MFILKGEMVCSGGFDEMGKQMSADYCIPEKNGDWYVSIFDDCLNHAFKKFLLTFLQPCTLSSSMRQRYSIYTYNTYISVMVMTL